MLAVTVPSTVIVGGLDATTAWNVCAYASNVGALLATPATFTVAPGLIASSASISPASGPAQGLSAITVSGMTGVPTAAGALLTATLGGEPITDIEVIDGTSFSGVTGAHGAGAVALAVTTAAGTKTKAAAFTYSYGVTVSPNTAPNTSNIVLDITGAGFSAVTTWADTTTAVATGANGYVFLTNNAWNAALVADGPSDYNAMAVAPVSYCNTVLPISDVELICTLNLLAMINSSNGTVPTITPSTAVPNGTYTVTVVNEGDDIDASENSMVSSPSTFTVAPY
jgi:hypothetical protein